jgi:hypothetical protein
MKIFRTRSFTYFSRNSLFPTTKPHRPTITSHITHHTPIVSLCIANMEDVDKDSDNESDEDSAILRGLIRDEEARHSGIPLDDDDDEDMAPDGGSGIIDDTQATGPPPAVDEYITEATPIKPTKETTSHNITTMINCRKSRLLLKWKLRLVLPLIVLFGIVVFDIVVFDIAKESSYKPSNEVKKGRKNDADPHHDRENSKNSGPTELDGGTSLEMSDFCATTGSLHNLTFQMANYSSPVGSPSYLKMQHILRISSRFHVNSRDEIFESVEQNMAAMLESYGLTRLSNSTVNTTIEDAQDIIRIEMSYHGSKKEGSGTCVRLKC